MSVGMGDLRVFNRLEFTVGSGSQGDASRKRRTGIGRGNDIMFCSKGKGTGVVYEI
jgi:hypothetical protein